MKSLIQPVALHHSFTGFLIVLIFSFFPQSGISQDKGFSMEQVLSYPFPSGLTVSATGSGIAWTINKNGLRNIFVAQGPEFKARQLTAYQKDEGQEISSLSLSPDGNWCVYIRGGDFGGNWDDVLPVNALSYPEPPAVQIWSFPFSGGEPHLLGEGTGPVVSPLSDQVAFVKGQQIWLAPIDGSQKPVKLFTLRGRNDSPQWSPDGKKLAFRSNRGDHSFIGVCTLENKKIQWMDPSYDRDNSPRWSGYGSKVAFIRRNGYGGKPDSILASVPRPWKIMVADVQTGKAVSIWESPYTMRGSVPTTQGGTNLHWASGRIVFLSYQDGWPHLYSIPEEGGEALLLTPGDFMAEYISLSPDGKKLYFAGNTGKNPLDPERRHVVEVSVDQPGIEVLTGGSGLEWTPFLTGDGNTLAYISATAKRPPQVTVMDMNNHKAKLLGSDLIPNDFPSKKLVVPRQVIFKAPDGTAIHGTLFNPGGGPVKKPAVIFVHGGPPRQMLLGWHYSSYYSNAYAVNQYLASRGFVVLSVNYRLGIGYGYEFHRPPDGGTRGASEYQDIKAAGEWLAQQEFVDPARIGLYGGSYGGYLTAMALARNSDIFAVGVDISGVHDRSVRRAANMLYPDRYERAPDAERAIEVAWKSSPVAYLDTWSSPVLVIHADDDRNVRFSESTDLVERLRKHGVPFETLVIVDDTHHWLVHAHQLKVDSVTADFLIRHLLK